MGALGSRIQWLWARNAPGEPEAPREEQAAEVAVVQEERESEAGPVATSHGGRKRKASPGSPSGRSPRRKHTKAKGETVYSALFLRGEGSDIQIRALGLEWNLHRAYLCQSGYFASMFSGAWRESSMDTIDMQMPDENINPESLQDVLGSLYQGVTVIQPSRVISILATASMLQLDDLIHQCGEVMRETLGATTVCSYYYSAENYGLQNLRAICRQWLLDNLLIQRSTELLLEIPVELMVELISSSELLVIGVEIDVYNMLKRWMFLQLHPTWVGPQRSLQTDVDLWVDMWKTESPGTCFLDTDEGRAFVPVFQQLRLAYIISELPSAQVIEQDALIPATWVANMYKEQWLILLQAQQSRDPRTGDIQLPEIEGHSMRCGSLLRRDEQCVWRWAGFGFAWDLVVCYTNRRIVFRRSALNDSSGFGVSLLWQRKVAFRLRLVCLDRAGRVIFRKNTGYRVICLKANEELEVVNLENQDLVFPIYVSCNFLYIPGESSTAQREDS
ncbi:germ cell-less protein-like 1 [Thomomys bottae]